MRYWIECYYHKMIFDWDLNTKEDSDCFSVFNVKHSGNTTKK